MPQGILMVVGIMQTNGARKRGIRGLEEGIQSKDKEGT